MCRFNVLVVLLLSAVVILLLNAVRNVRECDHGMWGAKKITTSNSPECNSTASNLTQRMTSHITQSISIFFTLGNCYYRPLAYSLFRFIQPPRLSDGKPKKKLFKCFLLFFFSPDNADAAGDTRIVSNRAQS